MVNLYSEDFNQVCVRPGKKPLDRVSHERTQIITDYTTDTFENVQIK